MTTYSLTMELESGNVTIKLNNTLAPKHVARIVTLAQEGFYNNCPFHRVIEGFMAQTGDGVNQDGTGGSHYPDLKQEFSEEKHLRGTVSMARASDPDSANSQFFICTVNCPHLDGQYTVFGDVTKGMELIDRLKTGMPGSGIVRNPDRIKTLTVHESN